MLQVGDWGAVPYRVPYSGEILSNVQIQIDKDGFYLVQLEVARKAEGEGIDAPTTAPLGSRVFSNGKEIGSAKMSGWFGQDEVYFGVYRFPATIGQRVWLSVKPRATLSAYKSHELHLVVQRDDWDYGIFMWRQAGWALLVLVFSFVAAGLLFADLKALIFRQKP